jgi:dCMP deaminase
MLKLPNFMDKRIKQIQESSLGTRPTWDEIMMHTAITWASRSSCENVHSATIISYKNQIISEGYNGAPSKIKDNCLKTGCRKALKGLDYNSSLNCGECIGIHSEMNAIGYLSKKDSDSIVVYNTIFPCHTCAKNLLPYNPQKIVFKNFYSDKELASTLDILSEAGVEIFQLNLSPKRYFDIAFNHSNAVFDVWSKDEKERMNSLLKLI